MHRWREKDGIITLCENAAGRHTELLQSLINTKYLYIHWLGIKGESRLEAVFILQFDSGLSRTENRKARNNSFSL